jgi:NAD(P)-dependent dehydrogenase (short-subunit alcohol dehydrogenase family)
VEVLALELDVTNRQAFEHCADRAESVFGSVHVLCNNAGIGYLGPLRDARYEDWDWVLGVNLGGIVNGLQTFLPRIRNHRQGGHILSTASVAGLIGGANAGIYTGAKMAVVGIMECLRGELAEEGIGVSVLCPHLVRTSIHEHAALRPARFATAQSDAQDSEAVAAIVAAGMDPLEVARKALRGIERNDLYILTHPEIEPIVRERFNAILAAVPDEIADAERVKVEAPTLHYSVYTEHLERR